MADDLYFHRLVSALGPNEDGLSDDEVAGIEARYGFKFPPDLRGLLQYCVPVAGLFPRWRGDPAQLEQALRRPGEELRFEVEHNGFWLEAWGPRPVTGEAAVDFVAGSVAMAPVLIPVYGRRYLPAVPCDVCNPVLTVDGTNVSHAGYDLVEYFKNEFHVPFVESSTKSPRRIAFWSDLVQ